ncbi:cadherin-17-like [Sardina pilchardus]|uniref:cadherin-17-like n=1 Tax=Sardina pilchardus TaxID=27697 RepID=UPI002E148D59
MEHLLLLALLLSSSYGIALESIKGPLESKALFVPEATAVPYAIHQFVSAVKHVTAYRVSGDLEGISMSEDGWLYLTKSLAWSNKGAYSLQVTTAADVLTSLNELNVYLATDDDVTVDGPYDVALTVVDINNNLPTFDQDLYGGQVIEHSTAGKPFVRVVASDTDDPNTANAALRYSIVKQIPITQTAWFQIDPETGEISTTEDGAKLLKARAGFRYSRGEERGSREVLEKNFKDFCLPTHDIPYEDNPLFACMLRSESRQVDAITDPDYTLIVKAEDMGGALNALWSSTRVDVVVRQNLWKKPEPIALKENLKYPMPIATVTSNDPDAIYSLVQKERFNFPFSINAEGEIFVTRELDRENEAKYTLVVFAKDDQGVDIEKPMEILVTVTDENDNAPECGKTLFEVQEDESTGSLVGHLEASDADDENTPNALLTYKLLSQSPATESMFSLTDFTGEVKVIKGGFQRSIPEYTLTYSVSDGGVPAKAVECQITVKVIDINNELPLFEKNNYGNRSVAENAGLGTELLTVKANDADDPGTGSSKVEYSIADGDPDGVFTIKVDEATGQGKLTIAKPLDFEKHSTYTLQIHARNPEPLVKGLEYDERSTAVVRVDVDNVDEAPVFELDLLAVNVLENLTVGATVLNIKAQDPEGKEIMFNLEGDERGWFEIDSASGELKTKAALDYEEVQDLTVMVIAYEKDAPDMQTKKEVAIHLMNVNDNVSKLVVNQSFICVKDLETPLVIEAEDKDAEPFGGPFTLSLVESTNSTIWEFSQVNGTFAHLTLKKIPPAEQTFNVPINIKDMSGMEVTHTFNVTVCNCTEFGSCVVELSGGLCMEETIGLVGGFLAFIGINVLVIVVRKSKKKSKKPNAGEDEVMMKT